VDTACACSKAVFFCDLEAFIFLLLGVRHFMIIRALAGNSSKRPALFNRGLHRKLTNGNFDRWIILANLAFKGSRVKDCMANTPRPAKAAFFLLNPLQRFIYGVQKLLEDAKFPIESHLLQTSHSLIMTFVSYSSFVNIIIGGHQHKPFYLWPVPASKQFRLFTLSSFRAKIVDYSTPGHTGR
jgi:hypothetical protein